MYKILKALADFFVALILLVLVSPLLFILILFLAVANKGKPFFTQLRPGKNEKIFRVIKFKTMTDERDGSGILLPDEKRLTPVGRFVRKTSLDELPQLLNVVKGDMSFVGPRPLLVDYLNLYNEFQKQRHQVKPGITGWAQVNGRNAISWDQKFAYDIHYVEHQNFWLDMKILFKTVEKVIKKEGISSQGTDTGARFLGNDI